MTYRKVKRLKAKHLSTFEEEGITYKVFVTPENTDDLAIYLKDIRGFYSQLTDRVAKKYSKNGKFVLHGLNYRDKNPHVLCKVL